jgi:hypothetical protein
MEKVKIKYTTMLKILRAIRQIGDMTAGSNGESCDSSEMSSLNTKFCFMDNLLIKDGITDKQTRQKILRHTIAKYDRGIPKMDDVSIIDDRANSLKKSAISALKKYLPAHFSTVVIKATANGSILLTIDGEIIKNE